MIGRLRKLFAANELSSKHRAIPPEREVLSTDEFIREAGLPVDDAAKAVVEIIRTKLAEIAHANAGEIYPQDRFDGDFGRRLQWPEFGLSMPIYRIEEILNIKISDQALEHVVDPSSPGRRGTVSDLVREIYNLVIIARDGLTK